MAGLGVNKCFMHRFSQFNASPATDITLGKSGSFFRSGDPGPQKVNGAVLSVHLCNNNC